MRTPKEIMREVRSDWDTASYMWAQPYVDALETLNSWNDKYLHEDAKGLALYFLANASGWRGEVARRVKEEIKQAIKEG